MIVNCLKSNYRDTNNYFVEIQPQYYIAIDIGSIALNSIKQFLNDRNADLLAVFVTHAHADHCIGIKYVFEYYEVPIYCSKQCSEEINNSRKNLSIYSDEIPTFAYDLPFNILKDKEVVTLLGQQIIAHHVPGHSPGCMLYEYSGYLFTGDFLMQNYKTPLRFPNSSKSDYHLSMSKIYKLHYSKGYFCFPGHGEPFMFEKPEF